MSSFKAFFIKHRTIILAVGIPLVVIIVILSLPIIPASIPVTETYWETQTVTQPYTDNETYTDMVPYQATETHTDTVINGPVSYGNWSQSFKVDNPGTVVTINITNTALNYYYSPQYYPGGDNYTPPYLRILRAVDSLVPRVRRLLVHSRLRRQPDLGGGNHQLPGAGHQVPVHYQDQGGDQVQGSPHPGPQGAYRYAKC